MIIVIGQEFKYGLNWNVTCLIMLGFLSKLQME